VGRTKKYGLEPNHLTVCQTEHEPHNAVWCQTQTERYVQHQTQPLPNILFNTNLISNRAFELNYKSNFLVLCRTQIKNIKLYSKHITYCNFFFCSYTIL